MTRSKFPQLVIDQTVRTPTVIEQALANESRLAAIRDGKRAAVKVALSEKEKHKVSGEATAAAIVRWRERTGRKVLIDRDLSKRQRTCRKVGRAQ